MAILLCLNTVSIKTRYLNKVMTRPIIYIYIYIIYICIKIYTVDRWIDKSDYLEFNLGHLADNLTATQLM